MQTINKLLKVLIHWKKVIPLIQCPIGCRNKIVFNIGLGILEMSTGGFIWEKHWRSFILWREDLNSFKAAPEFVFWKVKVHWEEADLSLAKVHTTWKIKHLVQPSFLCWQNSRHILILSSVESWENFSKEKKKKSPNYLDSEAWKAAKENCVFSITTTCASLHTSFHKSWIMVYCVPSRNTDSLTSSHWHDGVLEQKATSLWVSLHWVPIRTSGFIFSSWIFNLSWVFFFFFFLCGLHVVHLHIMKGFYFIFLI